MNNIKFTYIVLATYDDDNYDDHEVNLKKKRWGKMDFAESAVQSSSSDASARDNEKQLVSKA